VVIPLCLSLLETGPRGADDEASRGCIHSPPPSFAGLAIPAGEAKSQSIRIGEAVAAKVLQARTNDGSEAVDAYRPKALRGVYVPTAVTVGSTWPGVKPFALTGPAQFRPPAPIALGSEEWKTDYNELKDLGRSRISMSR
jgi:hypothetical protein